MWVAVFVVPGGVLLLPALIWRRGAVVPAVAAPQSIPTGTTDSAA